MFWLALFGFSFFKELNLKSQKQFSLLKQGKKQKKKEKKTVFFHKHFFINAQSIKLY
jgi:hypothetical protein